VQPASIEYGTGIDIVNTAVGGALVAWTIHREPKRSAVSSLREHLERIKNALDQHVVAAGLNRRQHINDLGNVRDFDDVRIAHETMPEPGHDQRVLKVVHLLEEMWRNFALAVFLVVLVPHVPFIET